MAEDAGLEEALVETECNLAEVMAIHPRDYEHSGPLARKALASARTLQERPDLVARALATLARVEVFAGRFEEAAAYAEEGAALSRELADRPAPRTELPPTITPAMGLSASWRAGNRVREIHCLTYLAYARIFQGRPQEGIAIGREAQAISGGLPERIEAMSTWALNLGFVEIGEYEEVLEVTACEGPSWRARPRTCFCCGSTSTTSVGRTRYCWTYRRRVGSMRRR